MAGSVYGLGLRQRRPHPLAASPVRPCGFRANPAGDSEGKAATHSKVKAATHSELKAATF